MTTTLPLPMEAASRRHNGRSAITGGVRSPPCQWSQTATMAMTLMASVVVMAFADGATANALQAVVQEHGAQLATDRGDAAYQGSAVHHSTHAHSHYHSHANVNVSDKRDVNAALYHARTQHLLQWEQQLKRAASARVALRKQRTLLISGGAGSDAVDGAWVRISDHDGAPQFELKRNGRW